MKYLKALFTPGGRLPGIDYACTIVPLFFLGILIRHKVFSAEDEPSQIWQAASLVLIWMHFCLTSRRLQDMSYPGFVCFPFFAVIAIRVVKSYSLDDGGDESGSMDVLMFIAQKASSVAMLMIAGCGGLIFGESVVGSNYYGPPFDAQSKKKPRDTEPSAGAARLQIKPNTRQTYGTEGPAPDPRAAPSRSSRQQGFGRR